MAPDQLADLDRCFAERRRRHGDLYDYQIAGIYHMAPAPGGDHATTQASLIAALSNQVVARGWRIAGPTNLGRLDGDYVVPDVVIARSLSGPSTLDALIAIEVLSPTEDESAKVADYQTVVATSGLVLSELWYVDPIAGTCRMRDQRFELIEFSSVLGLSPADVARLAGPVVRALDLATCVGGNRAQRGRQRPQGVVGAGPRFSPAIMRKEIWVSAVSSASLSTDGRLHLAAADFYVVLRRVPVRRLNSAVSQQRRGSRQQSPRTASQPGSADRSAVCSATVRQSRFAGFGRYH